VTGPALPDPPSRGALLDQLVRTRIAGDVATPRDNNLRNIGLLCDRQEGWTFGLSVDHPWTPAEVFDVMVRRVGIDPDPARTAGPDRIDPQLTLAAADRMRDRLAELAASGGRVVVATGHPAGIFAIHAWLARGLAAAGAQVLTPAAGWSYQTHAGAHREIRWLGGVAVVSNRGELNHTHSARPMEGILATLREAGDAGPDLVCADHGWAGAAGQAGVPAVGFADCNDPALFVGEAEGKVAVAVPLDDNVQPHLYGPLTAYLLDGWSPIARTG
jgi:hypothetical protein